jgi:hypothetical protein
LRTIDIMKADICNEAKLLDSRVQFMEWKANIKHRALTLQMKRDKVPSPLSFPFVGQCCSIFPISLYVPS